MTRRRRLALWSGLAVLAFALLIAVEVFIAARVQRIDAYPRSEIDRSVGSGRRIRMVWIGDSTSVGVGASSADRALPVLVAERLGVSYDLSVLGVSGATTSDAIRDQLPLLAGLDADWVFVAIGNNDVTGLTTRGALRRRLGELLDGVAETRPERLVVLGIAEFGSTPLFARPLRNIAGLRARQLDEVVREVALDHGALYVPIADLTGEGFASDPKGTHAADRFHPNDAGYTLWAEAVVATVRETEDPGLT